MTLKETIKRVKALLGSDFIYDSRIVLALNDFGAFEDHPAYKRIIHCLVEDGLIRDYARASSRERDIIVQRVFNTYGYEISFIKDIFSSFFDESLIPYTALQDKTRRTELIFVIDCSCKAASSYASIKFFFDNLKISVKENISARIVCYNESAEWIVKDGVELESIVLPNPEQITFEGANNLSQALIETCDSNIKWENTVSKPIIIWLTTTEPQDSFQNTITKLWKADVLYNRAYRISISFGHNISLDTLRKFSSDKDLTFRSIEIEEIISAIISHCGHDLHYHVEDAGNDIGEDLYIKKCKEQTDASHRHQEKLRNYAGVVFAFKENGKWGWRKITGEIIVAPQYETIKEFHEGLAAVSSRGFHGTRISQTFTWGFINVQGQKVIQEDYDDVENFIWGTAIVHKQQTGWGVINRTGEIVIPCEHYRITRIDNYLFKVQSKSYKYAIYNILGRQICEHKYDDISDFRNGFAIVQDKGASYLMNVNGRIVAKLPNNSRFSPIYGIIEIENWQTNSKTLKGLCGYDGVEILPTIYTTIMFGEKYILTCSEDGYDVFDLNGHKLNSYPYLNARINGEYLVVQTKDENWHFFKDNKLGDKIPFNEVYYIFDNGSLLVEYRYTGKPEYKFIATVSSIGKLLRRPCHISSDCTIIVKEYYTDLICLQMNSRYNSNIIYINKSNGFLYKYSNQSRTGIEIKEEFAIVEYLERKGYYGHYESCKRYHLFNLNEGRWMIVDTDKDGKIKAKDFDGLRLPSDGLCCFEECGRFGFIDINGKTQIEPIYDKATDFKNGLSIVTIGSEMFIIDMSGYRLTQENYEDIKYIQSPINYGEESSL